MILKLCQLRFPRSSYWSFNIYHILHFQFHSTYLARITAINSNVLLLSRRSELLSPLKSNSSAEAAILWPRISDRMDVVFRKAFPNRTVINSGNWLFLMWSFCCSRFCCIGKQGYKVVSCPVLLVLRCWKIILLYCILDKGAIKLY